MAIVDILWFFKHHVRVTKQQIQMNLSFFPLYFLYFVCFCVFWTILDLKSYMCNANLMPYLKSGSKEMAKNLGKFVSH